MRLIYIDLLEMGGGERGIRTLDRGLTYTPLAGERLQPLGHLSGKRIVAHSTWVLSIHLLDPERKSLKNCFLGRFLRLGVASSNPVGR